MPVDDDPKGLAQASDGTIWVICRDADTILILNPDTGQTENVINLDYGSIPVAIAPSHDRLTMYVSCEGKERMQRFSTSSQSLNGSVDLGPSPRAIAITPDGSTAYVTRFISGQHTGEIYEIDLSGAMSWSDTITLLRDRTDDGSASGRGVPNYLSSICISPDGQYAWVVGKKDNTNRGTFFSENLPLGSDTTVRAQLMLIDLSTGQEATDFRLDLDNSDSPSAITFSPLGDYAFIALQGNAKLAVIDVLEFIQTNSPGSIKTRITTGLAPQAALMDQASGRIFTLDFMDRTVTAIEIADFLLSGSANIPYTTVSTVANELLHPSVLLGKQIFYHASDPRMSAEGYISCATCHIDGGHDGRTFDFTDRGEGLRNTIDLRGRSGMRHGLVHWSANFDEIQDFENDIRYGFGGTGFLSDSDFANTNDTLGNPKAGLSEELGFACGLCEFAGFEECTAKSGA